MEDVPRKLVIQMSGAPGSGKTTLATQLAPKINAVIIDHDLLKTFFLDNDIPFGRAGKLAYQFQWVLAENMIKQGRSVIIDSTCNYHDTLQAGKALAQGNDCFYKYIECRVRSSDIDLLDQRLRQRVPMRSQRTGVDLPPSDSKSSKSIDQIADYHALFKNWIEHPFRPDEDDLIVVDSSGQCSVSEILDHALTQIALAGSKDV